jgi:hypothetical protein
MEEAPYVDSRKYRREASRTFGTFDRPDIVEVEVKDLLVQEDEGIEGLVLRRGGDAAFGGKMVEKGSDIVSVEVARARGVVEAHVAAGPRGVRLLSG